MLKNIYQNYDSVLSYFTSNSCYIPWREQLLIYLKTKWLRIFFQFLILFRVTVQLTAQNISGHQLATLSQFKPNTPQGGAVPQQQLLQLQHLPYKQLQQIQIRQPQVATSTSASKSKNKKRTTPTPPKQWGYVHSSQLFLKAKHGCDTHPT